MRRSATGAVLVVPLLTLETMLVLLIAVLVGAALVTARCRRSGGSAADRRDWTAGPAWIAVPGAVLLPAVTALLVVLAGWPW